MKRSGYTLVECIVIVSISAVILSMVGTLIASLSRAQRRYDEQIRLVRVVDQLGMRFRADIRAASGLPVERIDVGLRTLAIPVAEHQTREYQAEPNRVVRTVKRGDTVEHRDVYLLPPGTEVGWRISEDEQRNLAAMALTRRTATTSGRPADTEIIVIEAPVSADWRFTRHHGT